MKPFVSRLHCSPVYSVEEVQAAKAAEEVRRPKRSHAGLQPCEPTRSTASPTGTCTQITPSRLSKSRKLFRLSEFQRYRISHLEINEQRDRRAVDSPLHYSNVDIARRKETKRERERERERFEFREPSNPMADYLQVE